jgi:hypothetical protein
LSRVADSIPEASMKDTKNSNSGLTGGLNPRLAPKLALYKAERSFYNKDVLAEV